MAKFESYLKQNHKQIRDKHAQDLAERTELAFRQTIENLYIEIKDLDRTAEGLLLELCPSTTTTTRVGPSDYNPDQFVERDLEIAFDKSDKIIELEIAVNRYEELFGPYKHADQIKEVIPTWKSKLPDEEPKNS